MTSAKPNAITIRGVVIPYEERRNARSKRLSLHVGQDKVRVTAPYCATQRQIREFVHSNQDWILTHWDAIQARQAKFPGRLYQDGESYPLLFNQYIQLRIHPADGKQIRLRYDPEENRIAIELPEGLAPDQSREATRGILEKWLKRKAREVFQAKLDAFSSQMGVNYQAFRLKEQKTRWGSCSSRGNINLNWRAVMAPEPVVDYLIIHELAHLKHLNHSPAFWDVVRRYCPQYASWRRWLKVNGEQLILY